MIIDIQLSTLSFSNMNESLDVKNMPIKHDVGHAFDDPLDSWLDFCQFKCNIFPYNCAENMAFLEGPAL